MPRGKPDRTDYAIGLLRRLRFAARRRGPADRGAILRSAKVAVRSLGLDGSKPPLEAVVASVEKRISRFQRKYPGIRTLDSLVELVAQSVKTRLKTIHSDADLAKLKAEYAQRSGMFAVAANDLASPRVYGFTVLTEPELGCDWVSVIDCRGEKAAVSYLTRWHELTHLLLLPRDPRTGRVKTQEDVAHLLELPHGSRARRLLHGHELAAAEQLIDCVAAYFAFYPPFLDPRNQTLQQIERARRRGCKEASRELFLTASLFALNNEAVFVRGRIDKAAVEHDRQGGIWPAAHMRVSATSELPGKMRVRCRIPESSVLSRTFLRKKRSGDAEEDARWLTAARRFFQHRRSRVFAMTNESEIFGAFLWLDRAPDIGPAGLPAVPVPQVASEAPSAATLF